MWIVDNNNGNIGGDSELFKIQALLQKYGVPLWINGHDHSGHLDRRGPAATTTSYLTIGHGGLNSGFTLDAAAPPGSTLFGTSTPGFTSLVVTPQYMNITFWDGA